MTRGAVLVVAALAACGGEAQSRRGRAGPITAARLYPLAVGNAWSYDVDNPLPDGANLLVNRVAEREGRRVTVVTGQEPVVYEVRRDGIYWPAKGGYLLKDPISVGAGWGSRTGSHSRIVSVSRTVEAAGQTFHGCVEVILDGEDQRVKTLYAPDVGPVYTEWSLRLEGHELVFRGRLRGYQVE